MNAKEWASFTVKEWKQAGGSDRQLLNSIEATVECVIKNLDVPRRARIDKMTPAELAIRSAMLAVEEAGCDTRLTEAVVLLEKARNKVSDFVDGVKE